VGAADTLTRDTVHRGVIYVRDSTPSTPEPYVNFVKSDIGVTGIVSH